MKLLIQRCKSGAVHIGGSPVANIGSGLVVLAGFGSADTLALPQSKIWQTMLKKMLELRIFPDTHGKMNLSLTDFGGELLLVPQFTLYADCRKGRRPSFIDACPPDTATALFDRLITDARDAMPDKVQHGVFGAEMDVTLTNWGPVTITLCDSMFQRG